MLFHNNLVIGLIYFFLTVTEKLMLSEIRVSLTYIFNQEENPDCQCLSIFNRHFSFISKKAWDSADHM